ncbi:MAG: TIGR02391 family protein [Mycobacterium sp.]
MVVTTGSFGGGFGTGPQGPVPPQQIRELPTEGLALVLLNYLAGQGPNQLHLSNLMNAAYQGYVNEPDRQDLWDRVSDAIGWIESRGLVGPTAQYGQAQRLTARGRELAADGRALKTLFAEERVAGKLDPALEAKVRIPFATGDYEIACFAAMKEVEVAVRNAGSFDNSLIGVDLMKNAFSAQSGPLADTGAHRGEQVATMELFAGAIGAFKNPTSHRTVSFTDPVEAAEIIQLADLLLRIVRRAEVRIASSNP